MSLVTWQPKEALDNLFDTDRFFNAKPDRLWAELETITCNSPGLIVKFKPFRIVFLLNENFFHLEAATPGMQDKDINIEVHNDVLTIKGHKEDESDIKKENYHICEFSSQNFERSFKLSDRIDTDKVTAKIDNGVLRVDLPKHEQTKPQKIKVQSNP